MQIDVSNLTNKQLNWAVAKCEGFNYEAYEDRRKAWNDATHIPQHWNPVEDWSQSGPIIQRNSINLVTTFKATLWFAYKWNNQEASFHYINAAPLESAMRCYVTSKLGNCIEIPDKLLK